MARVKKISIIKIIIIFICLMLTVISEPRLTISKYYNFRCNENTRSIENFFKVIPASKWSLEAYTNYILEQSDLTINFEQVLTNFMESLDKINQLFVVPLSVRSVCQNYIDWLKVYTIFHISVW